MNKHLRTEAKKASRALHFSAQRAAEKRRKAQEMAGVFRERNAKLEAELTELRDAARKLVAVQDRWLAQVPDDAIIPGDWLRAYRKLKALAKVGT